MRPDPMIPEDERSPLRTALRLAAGLSLLAFFAVAVTPFLLGTPEDQNVFGASQTPTQTPSVVVEAASSSRSLAGAVIAAQVIETFEVFGGKNPFERPVLFPTQAGRVDDGNPTSTTIPGSAGPEAGVGGVTAGEGTNTDGQTTPTSTATTQPVVVDPIRNQAVALVDVFSDNGAVTATIRVGSTVYRVTEGDTFESSYRVLSLDVAAGCGSFMFGDSRFNLCEGQEILK